MTTTAKLPNRLHHTAYVTKDMEATRHFYEDILGLPLVATYAEQETLFGKLRTYCHCFFGLKDQGALAFFQFAYPDDAAEFGPELAPSPFRHVALHVDTDHQEELERRIAEAGIVEPQTYVLEHGYCRSLYVVDPNGMIVEFVVDAPYAVAMADQKRAEARADLTRWLAGDYSENNKFRPHTNV
jgi:glyoxylase I family protein